MLLLFSFIHTLLFNSQTHKIHLSWVLRGHHSSRVLNNKLFYFSYCYSISLFTSVQCMCPNCRFILSTFTVYCTILTDCEPLFKFVFIQTILHHQFSFLKNPNSYELRTSEFLRISMSHSILKNWEHDNSLE